MLKVMYVQWKNAAHKDGTVSTGIFNSCASIGGVIIAPRAGASFCTGWPGKPIDFGVSFREARWSAGKVLTKPGPGLGHV